jgi:adenosylcobinamide-phosphate synthase
LGSPAIAVAAILIERAFGYPQLLYERIGHPVSWMGACLNALDRRLNRERWSIAVRRAGGILAMLVLLAGVGAAAVIVHVTLARTVLGAIVECLFVAVLLAPRNLADHVHAVRDALETQGLAQARKEVSRIVGRDSDRLDASGVCRATIESLAENFSDGVIAPLFWYLLAGLAGIVLYKAINTADSMIGHRNARYAAFGWAAARLDDLVNLPAARLTGLLIVLSASFGSIADGCRAAATAWRDARRHRSPNAGWPEAAMAGALHIALGGPRAYDGHDVDGVWLGDGSPDAATDDIGRALALYDCALWLVILLLALASLIRF